MLYKKRCIKLPDTRNILLLGVRGSGKTALLKQRFPTALYIDLLNQSLYRSYLSNISLFYETIRASKSNLIIVDEIQRLSGLLNEVHRLIEESSRGESIPRQFILTGSSVRKLKAPGVNLLAGRAGKMYLHPFIPEELKEDFDLNTTLQYGLLPIVWSSNDKRNTLNDYVETYLKEEIKEEALVRNLPGFVRFLEVAGLYHGQAINITNVARECEVPFQAAKDFFSILEDTMLGFFIPSYSSKLRVREKKHKKFYLIDPGLARAFTGNVGSVSSEEKGFLFEGLIAQILRVYKDYYSLYDEMFYWSPAETKKTEVDFLLQKEGKFTAIEVKSSSQVSSQDYKGLKAIETLPNLKRRIVVYLGNYPRRTKEDIDIWPFDFFYKNLKEGNIFSSSN